MDKKFKDYIKSDFDNRFFREMPNNCNLILLKDGKITYKGSKKDYSGQHYDTLYYKNKNTTRKFKFKVPISEEAYTENLFIEFVKKEYEIIDSDGEGFL